MRHTALDTRTHRGLRITLHVDEDCESPRENDNLGTIIAWHRNYRLSDDDAPKHIEPADFDPNEYAICLPIFMYEHSGVALSTRKAGQFADRWDAGQVGWIYVTRDKLLHEYSAKKLTRRVRETAETVLAAEVEEYGRWCNGECYGYVVWDPIEPDEQLDSCWGFIGDEYAWEAAIEAANHEADHIDAKAEATFDQTRSNN